MTETEYLDSITTHTIYLNRHAETLGGKLNDSIDKTEKELTSYLDVSMGRFGEVTPTAETNKKFKKMESDVEAIRTKYKDKADNQYIDDMVALGQNEAVFTGKGLEAIVEDYVTTYVTNKAVQSIVNNSLNNGFTVKQYLDDYYKQDTKRIMHHVRSSMAQGLPTDDIIRGLIGTAKAKYTDGVLNATRIQGRTIARTTTNGIANQVRAKTLVENSDVVKKIKYSATLDGRTSPICRALDGRTWLNPEEAGEVRTPPSHYNCRSTLVPIVEGFEDMETRRPSANKDFDKMARERYNEKYPNKNWDDLKYSTRQRKYYDEIKAYEQETGKKAFRTSTGSYADYFARQPVEFQKSILGASRYKLYKEGGYTLDKFVDFNTGKQFTLEQLKQSDIKAMELLKSPKGKVSIGSNHLYLKRRNIEDGIFPAGKQYKELEGMWKEHDGNPKSFTKAIRNKEIEYGAVYDKDKKLQVLGKGDNGSIGIDIPKNAELLIHNHPDNLTFSTADIANIMNNNIKKAIIPTKNGQYVLTKTKKSIKLSNREVLGRYNEELHKYKSHNKAIKEVIRGAGYKHRFIRWSKWL